MTRRSKPQTLEARELLLRLLHQRLEEASDRACQASAMDQMAKVAALCVEAGRLAAVVDLLGQDGALSP